MNVLQAAVFTYVLFARHSNVVMMKKLFKNLPDDPTLDCHIGKNSSWVCYNRTDLLNDVNSEDSY